MPVPIGSKNKMFSLGFFVMLLIEFIHFPYKFKIIKRALPLNPGIILKIPTNIPFIKLIMLNYMINTNVSCLNFYN